MFINQTAFTSIFRDIGRYIADTLFPIRCLGCEKKGAWICVQCSLLVPRRLEQHCSECFRRVTPSGEVCFGCLPRVSLKRESGRDTAIPALDGVFVASSYRDFLIPHAIHTFKYRFIPDLAMPLANILQNALEKSLLPLPDAIIAVPLHPRRLRFRGFNQSELLARSLSQTITPGLELPLLTDTLLRTRFTRPQMKTDSREERLTNLKNAFAIATGKELAIRGASLWLIDDVTTTGATLKECAAVLKKNGAKSVFGIVLAG